MARVLNGNMAANHMLLIPDVSGGSQYQKGDTCQGGAPSGPKCHKADRNDLNSSSGHQMSTCSTERLGAGGVEHFVT